MRIRTALVIAILFTAACNDTQRAILSGLRSYRFTTTSMEPTIRNGEYLFAAPYRATQNPKRGEVIAFRYPLDPKTVFMSRVLAVPGDRVEIRDKALYVNGTAVAEPYVRHDDPRTYPKLASLPEPYRSRDHFGPALIPPDQFFVLGDNRDRSSDSRYWGCVPRANIAGRIVKAGGRSGPLRPIE